MEHAIRTACRYTSAIALAAALSVAHVCAAGAAQTTPTTFGANLASLTPQSSATCASLFLQSTCTLSTSADSLAGVGESFIVPQGSDEHGSGTITAFHVKVGTSTGQMQILLLQALRKPPQTTAACCSVVDATAAFVPAADSTTTIPVSWATENDNKANHENGVFAFDTMAISVAPGVAVPAAEFPGAIDTFWAPACPGTVGSECDAYGGDKNFVVTMSADWTPAGGSSPSPAPPPGPTPAILLRPRLQLAHGTETVKGSTVQIPLSCSTAPCVGKLLLQSAAGAGAARASGHSAHKRKPKITAYGSASFSIAAGASETVKIKLDAAGREVFAGHRQARVYMVETLKGAATSVQRVTLRKG